MLSRRELAHRWGCSWRTIDRLRQCGRLPWIDISGGRGSRPIVRFDMVDVQRFEQSMRRSTRLAALRNARGLSIHELAAQVRLPVQSLGLMENGQYPVDRVQQAPEAVETIEARLQQALKTDLTLTDLLGS